MVFRPQRGKEIVMAYLAIAESAVERAGGEIGVDSAPGHGTAITITL